MGTIILPACGPDRAPETWTDVKSIVITGANGSGKTRLGAWIEEYNPARPVHRIAAQRALDLQDQIQPMTHEMAQYRLLYGNYEPTWNRQTHLQHKRGSRWGNKPNVHMLTDYQFVVSMLFADAGRRNRQYTQQARTQVPNSTAPDCKFDTLQNCWKKVFPHRSLVIGDDKITAKTPDSNQEYAASMMSDGERVALYLLGQVLCAPDSAIVVIDEPEIHLHQAIQSNLWDEAEDSRQDCTFVYITHDLQFASTRGGARKIWAKSFDGTNWDWEELSPQDDLPESLLLEVLGSRRPVLLVEGDKNSHDNTLYRALYPDKLVLPMAGCSNVVDARRTLLSLNSLHNLAIDGLVDRDHRSDEEMQALRDLGLRVADVAEVENLFCIPEALNAVATQLKVEKPGMVIQAAMGKVLANLKDEIDVQVAARAIRELQYRLSGFGPKARDADAGKVKVELSKHLKTIDVDSVFERSKAPFERVLADADYEGALRYFNCKGIPAIVASAFDVKPGRYCDIVTGLVRSEPDSELAKGLRRRIE